MRRFFPTACIVVLGLLFCREESAAQDVTVKIRYEVGIVGMERPTVFVDVFNPADRTLSVYYTSVAEYKAGQAKGNAATNAKWTKIASNPVALRAGHYYFLLKKKNKPEPIVEGPVRIEKSMPVVLSAN